VHFSLFIQHIFHCLPGLISFPLQGIFHCLPGPISLYVQGIFHCLPRPISLFLQGIFHCLPRAYFIAFLGPFHCFSRAFFIVYLGPFHFLSGQFFIFYLGLFHFFSKAFFINCLGSFQSFSSIFFIVFPFLPSGSGSSKLGIVQNYFFSQMDQKKSQKIIKNQNKFVAPLLGDVGFIHAQIRNIPKIEFFAYRSEKISKNPKKSKLICSTSFG